MPVALVVEDIPVGEAVTWSLRTFGSVDVARLTVDAADCRVTAGSDAPDLSVRKVAEPARVAVGDRIEYTITVTNGGPAETSQVVVVDRQLDGKVSRSSRRRPRRAGAGSRTTQKAAGHVCSGRSRRAIG